MLKVASPKDWSRRDRGDAYSLAFTIEDRTATLSVTAEADGIFDHSKWRIFWTPSHDSSHASEGKFLFLHQKAMAEMILPPNRGGTLTMYAPQPPKKFVCRAGVSSWSSQLWTDVFPFCEDKQVTDCSAISQSTTFERVSERLEAQDIDGATNELALAVLGGPDADTLRAAKHLMETLARRPLNRSVYLGALACSLISMDVDPGYDMEKPLQVFTHVNSVKS